MNFDNFFQMMSLMHPKTVSVTCSSMRMRVVTWSTTSTGCGGSLGATLSSSGPRLGPPHLMTSSSVATTSPQPRQLCVSASCSSAGSSAPQSSE